LVYTHRFLYSNFLDNKLSIPDRQFTWVHELGHFFLDWHKTYYHFDDKKASLDAQADYFADQLLFYGVNFRQQIQHNIPSDISAIHQLASDNNTLLIRTLPYIVDCLCQPCFGIVLRRQKCESIFTSQSFPKQFAIVLEKILAIINTRKTTNNSIYIGSLNNRYHVLEFNISWLHQGDQTLEHFKNSCTEPESEMSVRDL